MAPKLNLHCQVCRFIKKMTERNHKVPGFDDLLFEKRNREYGAYQLRRKYNRVVTAGVIIAVFIGSAAVILPSLIRSTDDYVIAGGGNWVQVEMEALAPPEEMVYVPPPPPPPKEAGEQEILRYVAPVVVDSVVPLDLEPPATDVILAQGPESLLDTEGNGTGEELIPGEGGAGDGEAFFLVEVMPSFKGGGIDKFREWVNRRTSYPQAAIDGKIKGTVFLTFVVEKDGSVSNVTVIKGVHPLLDNEAVKAISESPKWTPGLQRGLPVRVRYQIPMSFTM